MVGVVNRGDNHMKVNTSHWIARVTVHDKAKRVRRLLAELIIRSTRGYRAGSIPRERPASVRPMVS